MIFIKSLHIRSYRSCIDTKLNLNSKLTSLIGINGAGKSTLLNSIFLLERLSRVKMHYFYDEDKISNICNIDCVLVLNKKDIYLRGKVYYNINEQNIDEVVRADLKWNFKEVTGFDTWITLPVGDYRFYTSENLRYHNRIMMFGDGSMNARGKDRDQIKQIIPYIKKIFEFLQGIKYYSASQFSNPSSFPNYVEIEDEDAVSRGRNSSPGEKFIFDLYDSSRKNTKEYKQFINTINTVGIGLIDELKWGIYQMPKNTFEVLSGGEIVKKERSRLLVVPNFVIDGHNLSPNQLSEGTIRTIALIFYILTDKSSVLLIEEPEICTHHGLLESIVALIKTKSQSKQIVMSTHSENILDSLEPEDIFLVKRNQEKGIKALSLTHSLKKNDFEVLKKYLSESGNLGDYWKEGGFDDN